MHRKKLRQLNSHSYTPSLLIKLRTSLCYKSAEYYEVFDLVQFNRKVVHWAKLVSHVPHYILHYLTPHYY